MELMQRLHDDGDEGQVELSDVGSDLRVSVTRVCIMAAQQGVNGTNGLFMKEENPTGKKKTAHQHIWCVSHCAHLCSTVFHFKVQTLIIPMGKLNEIPRAYPSPSGSRMRESSVSTRPDRKCCWRKGTESSNMVATPWSCTILENAELCGYNNR